MKNILKKIGFAALVVMAGGAAAFAATRGAASGDGFCGLLAQLHQVFVTLRTLAFVGAAFIIAGWAWGWIKAGKSVTTDDLKEKGTGMMVGFILLFSIGTVLSFFLSAAGQRAIGCAETILNW